jgi:hypothetical protein
MGEAEWKADQEHLFAEELAKQAKQNDRMRMYLAERKEKLDLNPFDPRTEVSADAKKIVTHLWILGFVVPLIISILYAMSK